MYKIAVVGDRDSIYGFSAIGLDIFPVENNQECEKTLKNLCEQDYGVIYITEAMAEQLDVIIQKISEQRLPAIILIPGISGNTGKGMSSVNISIQKAVGSDILGD